MVRLVEEPVVVIVWVVEVLLVLGLLFVCWNTAAGAGAGAAAAAVVRVWNVDGRSAAVTAGAGVAEVAGDM
jgi:hypothetical protein